MTGKTENIHKINKLLFWDVFTTIFFKCCALSTIEVIPAQMGL